MKSAMLRPKPIPLAGDRSEPSGLPYGLHFAYRGAFIKIGPEELASCLWSDGRALPMDIARARTIIDALAAKITGKAPSP